MKNKTTKIFLILIFSSLQLSTLELFSQTCVSCSNGTNNVIVGYNNNVNSSFEFQSILGNNNTTSRNNAVAIGTNSTASWSHSYVFGSNSQSNGIHSFAIGSNSLAQSTYSFAIGYSAKSTFGNAFSVGNFTRSDAVGAYVFGLGVSSAIPLVNNVGNSLTIGFKSTKPTLFVSESPSSANNDRTGSIGIGNITAPQAKLHIRADAVEDATLLLEAQGNKSSIFTLAGQTGNIVFSGGAGNIGVAGYRNPLNFYTADQQNNPRLCGICNTAPNNILFEIQ